MCWGKLLCTFLGTISTYSGIVLCFTYILHDLLPLSSSSKQGTMSSSVANNNDNTSHHQMHDAAFQTPAAGHHSQCRWIVTDPQQPRVPSHWMPATGQRSSHWSAQCSSRQCSLWHSLRRNTVTPRSIWDSAHILPWGSGLHSNLWYNPKYSQLCQ